MLVRSFGAEDDDELMTLRDSSFPLSDATMWPTGVIVTSSRKKKRMWPVVLCCVGSLTLFLLFFFPVDRPKHNKIWVPLKLVEYVKPVVADSRGRLRLPESVAENMGGSCMALDDYEMASSESGWQCQQSLVNPVFPGDVEKKDVGYAPSDQVLRMLANETGLSVEDLRDISIYSGEDYETSKGKWCGMPIADYSEIGGNATLQDYFAYQYWKRCVSRRSGYINVLQCQRGPKYAVIGFAALEPDVCYPAHMHAAEEAYWQIAGGGRWKTWRWKREENLWNIETDFDLSGAKQVMHVNLRDEPHEFDTKLDHRPMLLVYWWGLDARVPNDYVWVPEVRKGINLNATSCGTDALIPEADSSSALLDSQQINFLADDDNTDIGDC